MEGASDPTPTPDPTPAPSSDPAPAPSPAPSPLDRDGPKAGDPKVEDPSPASWREGLPDELRADKTLERYKSVEELARGHIEQRKLASSRVILPTEGDDGSFVRFAEAVRPKDADAYEITLPEGQDKAFADAMRPVFHDAGLHPEQVKRVVAANNAYADSVAQAQAKREEDALAGLKAEMGEEKYEAQKAAASRLFDKIGIPSDFDTAMAKMLGAATDGQGGAAFMRMAFELTERSGELGSVTADDVSLAMGNMAPEQASEAAVQMSRDYGSKLKPGDPEFDPAARKRYDALVARAAA